jgi:hypothetical protein
MSEITRAWGGIMANEQLALPGMPEPSDVPPHQVRALDDAWVQALVDDPLTRPHDLLAAFQNNRLDPRLRDTALQHPSIGLVDLGALIRDWPEGLQERAVSTTTNLMLLQRWATSRVVYERAVVAMNPHCPDDLAIMLSTDPEPAVRMNALCCPQLPRYLLRNAVTHDPDSDVRDFARWLITSPKGRALTSGERYFTADGGEDVGRVVAWGITRQSSPPV